MLTLSRGCIFILHSIEFFFFSLFYLKKMLSTAARTIKTNTLKRAVSPLTTSIRTKVTLPSLPYAYNVSKK